MKRRDLLKIGVTGFLGSILPKSWIRKGGIVLGNAEINVIEDRVMEHRHFSMGFHVTKELLHDIEYHGGIDIMTSMVDDLANQMKREMEKDLFG